VRVGDQRKQHRGQMMQFLRGPVHRIASRACLRGLTTPPRCCKEKAKHGRLAAT
jgi:hypothetical protein